MPWRGLEPPPLAGHSPQPCASADSATRAFAEKYYTLMQECVNPFTNPLFSIQYSYSTVPEG